MKSVTALFLVSSALLTGCQAFDWRPVRNPGHDEVLRTESGERFFFKLDEDSAEGYAWDCTVDCDDVEVTIDHHPPKASVRIRIHRGFDGPAVAVFSYRRPHEMHPVKTFKMMFFKRTGSTAFWDY